MYRLGREIFLIIRKRWKTEDKSEENRKKYKESKKMDT